MALVCLFCDHNVVDLALQSVVALLEYSIFSWQFWFSEYLTVVVTDSMNIQSVKTREFM